MSINSVSGQSSSLQISVSLSQGRAAGAGGHCQCGDGGGDGSDSQGAGSAADAPGASAFTTLVQQIQSAVDGALRNLDPSAPTNPADLLKTILDALDKALKDSLQGGSTAADSSKTADGATSADPATDGSASAGGDSSSSPNSSDAAVGPISPANTTPGANPTSLLDLMLGQQNVNPQQFKSDLFSALGSSQNGSVDFSIVFNSFPTGQAINSQA